ncbi:cytochrome ubiquinol oxidase subunit I [Rhodoblastus sp.]|uniref:cytochrome ubiquinol oxidase subunit I n=1 Tax=Rhodoblastus sp. TaxID=1962975 RepID=UPI00314519EF
MMELGPLILSRIQFAFVVSFHIIFPSFTIGLAAWLTVLEAMSLATGQPVYRRLFDFWLKVFALAFAMGVVSGIVMAFQFGTNWSALSERTGAIQGPLLGYEAFTAFLLEASFFGIMLFGRERTPRWFYFFSCAMVALGTMASSYWIMCNNSWMQVPLGYSVVEGKIVPEDWKAILLGPVQLIRWPHMLLGAFLTTSLCVAAAGAWNRLRGEAWEESHVMLDWGLGLAAVLIPAQILLGHLAGEIVHKYQPAKFAAIEARWHDEQPASEVLIGWPDARKAENLYAITVPDLGSFIATGTWDSREVGVQSFPAKDRPPVVVPFFAFRIMFGLGVAILALSWTGLVLRTLGGLEQARWFLWLTFVSFPAGFIAVIAGWFTAEVGRQPWVVYGLLRTRDAVTPSLSTPEATTSLIAFILVYALIYGFGVVYFYRLFRDGLTKRMRAASGYDFHAERPL